MRRSTRRIRIEHVAALIAVGLSCAAQDTTTVGLSNGVQIEVTASFGHPTGEETLTVEMARASGNSFYRIFRDQNHLAVYAYELVVDLGAGGENLMVNAKPVEDAFGHRYANADGGKPVPSLPTEHELGPLASGQSATLTLFEIPGMGLAISETIKAKLNQSGGAGGALHFAGIQVFVEKKLISGPAPKASVSGRFAMFYIPGRGGYFFSTQPVPDRAFINAGSIDGKHLDFSLDNETFHVTADAPIVTQSESSGLWVYHDAAYVPSGTWTLDLHGTTTAQSAADAFFTAASDTLNWWLPSQ